MTEPIERLEWHCLRTQTKREHIAANILSQQCKVEVFCPRVSQIKKTRTGKKRFTEALFPSYIFARFDYNSQFRHIIHTQGVVRIVSNGERRVVPEAVVEGLKTSLPDAVIKAPDPSLETGAEIEILSGSLKGIDGKVLACLPAEKRVEILLDFLGREITITLDPDAIILKQKR
ncbi:MAG: Transcription antitermination protein RfaH [Opitutia bacterium UBA7350]|nr:MAG: Transcription antitermination protein RfaH [Opitutae bacterium UBA7350]